MGFSERWWWGSSPCAILASTLVRRLLHFAGLLKLEPQLQSQKAYGTDGEEAFVKAPCACFPKAVGLHCFLHKQRKLEERLKLASATVTTDTMRNIFGVQGEVFSKGLVDAASEETFDLQLQQLCESWETLVPGFPKWFVDTQASTFCMYMIVPVHEKAQLGSHIHTCYQPCRPDSTRQVTGQGETTTN